MRIRLYVLQRATALVMAPLLLGHVALIFYATRHGLTAADILGRTRGSAGWGLYYGLFVVAAAIHAGIGVRVLAAEWAPHRVARDERLLDALMWAVGLALAGLGLRAVAAVALP